MLAITIGTPELIILFILAAAVALPVAGVAVAIYFLRKK